MKKLTIIKEDLENDKLIAEILEKISDYPYYINRSNISRGEILAIWAVYCANLDNNSTFSITIKTI